MERKKLVKTIRNKNGKMVPADRRSLEPVVRNKSGKMVPAPKKKK